MAKRNKKMNWRKPLIKLPEEYSGLNQKKSSKKAVSAVGEVEPLINVQCKEVQHG